MNDRLVTAMLNLESLRRAQSGDTSPFVAPEMQMGQPNEAAAPEPMAVQPRQRRPVVTTRTFLPAAYETPEMKPRPVPAPTSGTPSDFQIEASHKLPPWIAAHPGTGKEWEYDQSTGTLSYGGVPFSQGYAGRGHGRNNPDAQYESNTGPPPVGTYTIGPASDMEWNGRNHPDAMYLKPNDESQMHGRSGFFIHGGGPDASEGCIILSDGTRVYLSRTNNRILRVVPGHAANPNMIGA